MLDQRGLKTLRYFSIGMLLLSGILNVVLIANYYSLPINFIPLVDISNFNVFFGFSFLMSTLGSIFNRVKEIPVEIESHVKQKMKPFFIGLGIFIIYLFFNMVMIKKLDFIISALIMTGIYINIIIITKSIVVTGLNDYQSKWRAAVYGEDYNSEGSSIFWRFKFWITPIEKVPFQKRPFNTFSLVTIAFFLYFIYLNKLSSIIDIIFIIIILRNVFILLEYILGLYTSLTGICTGVRESSESTNSSRTSSRTYWTVYVTDFKKKREVTYRTYHYPNIQTGDDIKVIHGIISKKVIISNCIQV